MIKKSSEYRKSKLARIAILGQSGSGKTYTSLLVSKILAGETESVLVIDTDAGASSYYDHLLGFDILDFGSYSGGLYDPAKLTSALSEIKKEDYSVVIIDSLSPFYAGPGGLYEQYKALEKNYNPKVKQLAWGDVNPLWNRLIEILCNYNSHVICTIRSEAKFTGRTTELRDSMRSGYEFGFDLILRMDGQYGQSVLVEKSRLTDYPVGLKAKPDTRFFSGMFVAGRESPQPRNTARNASPAADLVGENPLWPELPPIPAARSETKNSRPLSPDALKASLGTVASKLPESTTVSDGQRGLMVGSIDKIIKEIEGGGGNVRDIRLNLLGFLWSSPIESSKDLSDIQVASTLRWLMKNGEPHPDSYKEIEVIISDMSGRDRDLPEGEIPY